MSTGAAGTRERHPHRAAGPWRVAEWCSLLVSALIVCAIAVFLVVQALGDRSPLVAVEARLVVERSEARGSTWVTPLEVRVIGHRTLGRVVVAIRAADAAPDLPPRLIELTYLGPDDVRTAYVIFDRDPRTLGALRVEPLLYELE